jgi:hypothetical protein
MQIGRIQKSFFGAVLLLTLVLAFGAMVSEGSEKANTKCKMTFNLSGWSIIYETAAGTGSITCDNGQSSGVKLEVKGGGLTAGKYKLHGKGEFSEVSDISELFGTYAAAEAHAGAVKSADAQAMTKGSVSLAITAKGSGINLGVGFSGFKIEPLKKGR